MEPLLVVPLRKTEVSKTYFFWQIHSNLHRVKWHVFWPSFLFKLCLNNWILLWIIWIHELYHKKMMGIRLHTGGLVLLQKTKSGFNRHWPCYLTTIRDNSFRSSITKLKLLFLVVVFHYLFILCIAALYSTTCVSLPWRAFKDIYIGRYRYKTRQS